MEINIPPKVRLWLYIFTLFTTPVVAVLTEQAILPTWVLTLWTAEVAVVSSLAAFNVDRRK